MEMCAIGKDGAGVKQRHGANVTRNEVHLQHPFQADAPEQDAADRV